MLTQSKFQWRLFFRKKILWVLPLFMGVLMSSSYFSSFSAFKKADTNYDALFLSQAQQVKLYGRGYDYYQQVVKENKNPEEVAEAKKCISACDAVLAAAEKQDEAAYTKSMLALYKIYTTKESPGWQSQKDYYQYLVDHHQVKNLALGTRKPAILRFVTSTVFSDSTTLLVLMLLGLVIAYLSTYNKRKKTIDFLNLFSKSKGKILAFQYLELVGGTFLIFLGGALINFLIPWVVSENLGYFNSPYLAGPMGEQKVYVTSQLIFGYCAYLFVFICLLAGVSLLVQTFTKSFLLNLALLLLIPLSFKLPIFHTYSYSLKEILKFIPTSYLNISNVLIKIPYDQGFQSHFLPGVGLVLIAGYGLFFFLLAEGIVLKRKRL